ncbi:MAG: hypothetical protein HY791_12920 [Deltaproteobacteria bacterium]|nr:hypothetical protein [Deltaproteobacteria bacterium]
MPPLLALCACSKDPVGYDDPPPDGVRVIDPVTRKACDKTPTTPAAVAAERTYYFCSSDALQAFAAEPERFADPRLDPAPTSSKPSSSKPSSSNTSTVPRH